MQEAGEVRSVDVPESTATDISSNEGSEIVLDAIGSGTPEAQSEAVTAAEEGDHHEYFLGLDSYGWVGAAFFLFAAILIYLKVPGAIAKALDARGARIREELDEAKALRAEAETLLAEQQTRAAQSEKDAEAILAGARREADEILADARAQSEAMVARRTQMAEDKIAAAERAAEAELRARAADLSVDAARKIIAEHSDAATRTALTDKAISGLGSRLN